MCLPTNENKSSSYFSKMKSLKSVVNVKELSMGMSNDYLEAVEHETTYIRVGSKIFGIRS